MHDVVMTRGSPGQQRRWLVAVGVLLLTSGLTLAGYVAWQYWGTTWTAERRHEAVVEELQRAWTDGDRVAQVPAGQATAVVRVAAFGEDYAVPLLEGSSGDVLASGFGHIEDTAEPGEEGNFVLAGHRVTHGEPLREMPSLRPGDTVVVETADRTLTYILDTSGDELEVGFDASWVLAPLPKNPQPGAVGPAPEETALLTLVTCADLFHSGQRLVAFGHLISAEARTR
jgi:sortase A